MCLYSLLCLCPLQQKAELPSSFFRPGWFSTSAANQGSMYSSGQHWPSGLCPNIPTIFNNMARTWKSQRQVPWMHFTLPAPILTGGSSCCSRRDLQVVLPKAQSPHSDIQFSTCCWAVPCWCFIGILSMSRGAISPNSTEIFNLLATAKDTYVVFNSKRVFYRPGCISSIIPWCHTPRKTAVSPAWQS